MALDELMAVVGPMNAQAEALAAIAAKLQIDAGGGDGDPVFREHLDHVIDVLGLQDTVSGLQPNEVQVAVGFIRTLLHIATDVADRPASTDGWQYTDPVLLNGIGSASGAIAPLLAATGFDKANARILDIGSGVSLLSVALCNVFPGSTVVGLEPWETSRTLAATNIERAGLADRISVVPMTIEAYASDEPFDLVWLPAPFLNPAVLAAAVQRVFDLTAPGGWAVIGTFGEVGHPLVDALTDLRTVRTGGTPVHGAEAVALLEGAGFVDARTVPRTWNMPIGLNIGRRA